MLNFFPSSCVAKVKLIDGYFDIAKSTKLNDSPLTSGNSTTAIVESLMNLSRSEPVSTVSFFHCGEWDWKRIHARSQNMKWGDFSSAQRTRYRHNGISEFVCIQRSLLASVRAEDSLRTQSWPRKPMDAIWKERPKSQVIIGIIHGRKGVYRCTARILVGQRQRDWLNACETCLS